MSDDFTGTTITRASSRDRFTVVHNRTIEDSRLSFRALGLLVFVLSKPDNWKTHVAHLATTHSEGREAVRSALGELETFGYVERKWMRAEGELTPTMHYLVSELPACPEIGIPENWAPRIRDAQKPATSKEGSKEVVSTDSQQTVTDCFDAFWKVYPRKTDKGAARKAWAKAVKVAGDPDRIVQGAYRYSRDPNRVDEYTKTPPRWLNAECWDDEPLPSRKANGNGHGPPPQSTYLVPKFDTIEEFHEWKAAQKW
jgi:hypothetical protein